MKSEKELDRLYGPMARNRKLRNNPLTEEQILDIGRRYRRGESGAKIEQELDLPKSRIYKALEILKIPTRPAGRQKKRSKTPEEMHNLHLAGLTHDEIGLISGVSRQRVRQLIKGYRKEKGLTS